MKYRFIFWVFFIYCSSLWTMEEGGAKKNAIIKGDDGENNGEEEIIELPRLPKNTSKEPIKFSKSKKEALDSAFQEFLIENVEKKGSLHSALSFLKAFEQQDPEDVEKKKGDK